jgi:ankyrin repeat protein
VGGTAVTSLMSTSASNLFVCRDAEERTCLHYAAGYGHEECVGLLLDAGSDTRVRDVNGDVPLHFAAIHGHPMCAYNIAKVSLLNSHTYRRSRATVRRLRDSDDACASCVQLFAPA